MIAHYKGCDIYRLSFKQLACPATCPDHDGPLQARGLTRKQVAPGIAYYP